VKWKASVLQFRRSLKADVSHNAMPFQDRWLLVRTAVRANYRRCAPQAAYLDVTADSRDDFTEFNSRIQQLPQRSACNARSRAV